ncbi:MAG: YbhB/YbcL family Raf kinase inhibitor-like protein [Acidiphilium sp.]|nr:YbhB/YbcL family Raf kinase inhibitor-like protein [Acidiphilium sp.]MDD4936355.1 YbhB/YbcL family Raf kinase inhibitor-like protein [Acidiphilium sp.]
MKPLLIATLLATSGMAQAGGLTVTTPAFGDGGTIGPAQIYDQYGCTGQDISPAVAWSGAPAGTRSFTVVLFDSDARQGKGYWHWIVADIPAGVTHLAAGVGSGGSALPKGLRQGFTTSRIQGYQGPCPPVGDAAHHYHLRLYALKVAKLPAAALQSHPALQAALARDTLAMAVVTGRYGRPAP